jgi:hypothetical protein
MTNEQLAEQQRLSEILKLARMQLNEEYMKQHSIAHTAWITGARTAWTTTGTLLPFTTKFVYPTEEEVVARGVEIYNRLTQKPVAPVAAPVPATIPVITADPVDIVETVEIEQTTELLQAGGDFVIADVPKETVPVDSTDEVTDVVAKEDLPVEAEPTVTDSLLENKFKSLFTKWGGKGSF